MFPYYYFLIIVIIIIIIIIIAVVAVPPLEMSHLHVLHIANLLSFPDMSKKFQMADILSELKLLKLPWQKFR